jgi:hypothetical protein
MVTSAVTKGGAQKLPQKINIFETYWHDHALECSWGALSDTSRFSVHPIWKMHFLNFFSKKPRSLKSWTLGEGWLWICHFLSNLAVVCHAWSHFYTKLMSFSVEIVTRDSLVDVVKKNIKADIVISRWWTLTSCSLCVHFELGMTLVFWWCESMFESYMTGPDVM